MRVGGRRKLTIPAALGKKTNKHE